MQSSSDPVNKSNHLNANCILGCPFRLAGWLGDSSWAVIRRRKCDYSEPPRKLSVWKCLWGRGIWVGAAQGGKDCVKVGRFKSPSHSLSGLPGWGGSKRSPQAGQGPWEAAAPGHAQRQKEREVLVEVRGAFKNQIPWLPTQNSLRVHWPKEYTTYNTFRGPKVRGLTGPCHPLQPAPTPICLPAPDTIGFVQLL